MAFWAAKIDGKPRSMGKCADLDQTSRRAAQEGAICDRKLKGAPVRPKHQLWSVVVGARRVVRAVIPAQLHYSASRLDKVLAQVPHTALAGHDNGYRRRHDR